MGAFGVERQNAPKREMFTIGVPSPSLSPLGRPWNPVLAGLRCANTGRRGSAQLVSESTNVLLMP